MRGPRTYPHGVPSWVDTEQPDIAAACEFYGGLLGWTFEDAGATVLARLDGREVAGIAPEAGRPVAWNTYIAVDDAGAAAEAIASADGDVVAGTADAGAEGRFAVCADPRGAGFRLWQAGRLPGAQYVNGPGAWNFSDLYTGDSGLARRFYAPLFGWEFDELGFATMIRRPGYGDHLEATVDPGIRERQSADLAPPGFEDAIGWLADAGPRPDRWHVTFSVADRDHAAARTEALGGRVLGSDDTEWTRTALIRDPQGSELTLSQFVPPG